MDAVDAVGLAASRVNQLFFPVVLRFIFPSDALWKLQLSCSPKSPQNMHPKHPTATTISSKTKSTLSGTVLCLPDFKNSSILPFRT